MRNKIRHHPFAFPYVFMLFFFFLTIATRMIVLAQQQQRQDLPPHHPHSQEIFAKFRHHLKCPYANEWITHGPYQAAINLGIVMPGGKNNKDNNNQATTTESIPTNTMPDRTTPTRMRGGGIGGLLHHPMGRMLQEEDLEDTSAVGHCTFTNAWTGQPTCIEFRGDYSTQDMLTRCSTEADYNLILQENEDSVVGCMTTTVVTDSTSNVVGWCYVQISDTSMEAMPMMGDCTHNQMACETFISGTFQPTNGDCNNNNATTTANNNTTSSSSSNGTTTTTTTNTNQTQSSPQEPVTCQIAPGAIGAAHQAGYSMGYSKSCPGTPAEGSPYMWPLAWRAYVEAKFMSFGSDTVNYHSKSIVSYRLDKNWKRQDWYYQRGIQQSLGQSPCPPEDVVSNDDPNNIVLACRRNSEEYSTMIHRGSKMIFISWKNETEVGSSDPQNIAECNYLDLQVIGNVRPDWFLDDRGDSTDVQYLGNQHVFYDGEPRLVKQWRKKDFANQYFVMSMQGNPVNSTTTNSSTTHWPMVLNVPGEGFGDDILQIYTNHSSLTDDDDYLFHLDEAWESINGGSCLELSGFGGDSIGPPPQNSESHIPSNLEVDPNSWYSNVYTFSPVWEPDNDAVGSNGTNMEGAAAASTEMAVTEADRVTVKSCWDEASSKVYLSVEFHDVVLDGGILPWMALGFRETEDCLMTPQSGADTPIVLVLGGSSSSSTRNNGTQVYSGSLPPAARGGTDDALASIYSTLIPLSDSEMYSNVALHLPTSTTTTTTSDVARSESVGSDSSVVIEFSRLVDDAVVPPDILYLTYAIGSQPTLGFHATRSCFEVTEFPSCPTNGNMVDGTGTGDEDNSQQDSIAAGSTSTTRSLTSLVALVMTSLGMVVGLVLE